MCKYLAVSVAMDELRRNVEVKELLDSLLWQRAGQDIASDDDAVYFGVTYLLEHCIKRRKVGVNVVNGCDTHNSKSVPAAGAQLSVFTIINKHTRPAARNPVPPAPRQAEQSAKSKKINRWSKRASPQ